MTAAGTNPYRLAGSPIWLWVLAIVLGPGLFALFSFHFVVTTPYGDYFMCGDELVWQALIAVALSLSPAVLIALAGIIARAKWLKPALLALGCNIALLALGAIMSSLNPPFEWGGRACKLTGHLESHSI